MWRETGGIRWMSDPNGTRIEFHKYTAESMPSKGGTCVVNR